MSHGNNPPPETHPPQPTHTSNTDPSTSKESPTDINLPGTEPNLAERPLDEGIDITTIVKTESNPGSDKEEEIVQRKQEFVKKIEKEAHHTRIVQTEERPKDSPKVHEPPIYDPKIEIIEQKARDLIPQLQMLSIDYQNLSNMIKELRSIDRLDPEDLNKLQKEFISLEQKLISVKFEYTSLYNKQMDIPDNLNLINLFQEYKSLEERLSTESLHFEELLEKFNIKIGDLQEANNLIKQLQFLSLDYQNLSKLIEEFISREKLDPDHQHFNKLLNKLLKKFNSIEQKLISLNFEYANLYNKSMNILDNQYLTNFLQKYKLLEERVSTESLQLKKQIEESLAQPIKIIEQKTRDLIIQLQALSLDYQNLNSRIKGLKSIDELDQNNLNKLQKELISLEQKRISLNSEYANLLNNLESRKVNLIHTHLVTDYKSLKKKLSTESLNLKQLLDIVELPIVQEANNLFIQLQLLSLDYQNLSNLIEEFKSREKLDPDHQHLNKLLNKVFKKFNSIEQKLISLNSEYANLLEGSMNIPDNQNLTNLLIEYKSLEEKLSTESLQLKKQIEELLVPPIKIIQQKARDLILQLQMLSSDYKNLNNRIKELRSLDELDPDLQKQFNSLDQKRNSLNSEYNNLLEYSRKRPINKNLANLLIDCNFLEEKLSKDSLSLKEKINLFETKPPGQNTKDPRFFILEQTINQLTNSVKDWQLKYEQQLDENTKLKSQIAKLEDARKSNL